jgi:hypothetical protein
MKGEGMIKKFKELMIKNDEKEIDEELNKLILGELDDLNYSIEHNHGLKEEDAKALREINNMRIDNKKNKWELVKTIAQIFGITIGAAATIVGIIYTVKGHNFDCEWMNKIFEMKDSLNVIDPNSRTQANKFRENHRKMSEHLMNRKFM